MWRIHLMLVLVTVGCNCSDVIRCPRYSPEEAYYTLIRPSAVGTLAEMRAYFDALFPRVGVEEMVELMPQIKNDKHNYGNFSRALEFLQKFEYSTLIEIEDALDVTWEAFLDAHREALENEENARSVVAAILAVLQMHEMAHTKLDEACKELATFFHGVMEQAIEGLTFFLEEEANEAIEDDRKLASELQKMIWKKTKSNLLGLIVSRSLHRILNNKQRDINEPRLFKPINDAVKQIATGITSLLTTSDIETDINTFWRTKMEELYTRKDLRANNLQHLAKLFKNDEYVAEIMIDMMSYY